MHLQQIYGILLVDYTLHKQRLGITTLLFTHTFLATGPQWSEYFTSSSEHTEVMSFA